MFTIQMLERYAFEDYPSIIYPKKLFSTIYVRHDEIHFPQYQWDDFPVAISKMWIDCVIEVFEEQKAEFSLYFMDGPYRIDCIKNYGLVYMKYIADREEEIIVGKKQMQFSDLSKIIYHTSDKLMKFIKESKCEKVVGLQELKMSNNMLNKLLNIKD